MRRERGWKKRGKEKKRMERGENEDKNDLK